MKAKTTAEFNKLMGSLKRKTVWKKCGKNIQDYFNNNWFTKESIAQWADCSRDEYHKQMETTQASESWNQLSNACMCINFLQCK